MYLGSYIGVFDDNLHALAPKKGFRYKCDVDQGPSVAVSNDTTSVSIDTYRASEHKECEVCRNLLMEAPPRDSKSRG